MSASGSRSQRHERVPTGHSHGSPGDSSGEGGLRLPRQTRAWLVGLVVCLALGVTGALVALWPTQVPPIPGVDSGGSSDIVTATVLSVRVATCPGTSTDRAPDGTIPGAVQCGQVRLRLDEGPQRGTTVTVPADQVTLKAGLSEGTRVDLVHLPETGPDTAPATGDKGDVQDVSPGAASTTYALVDFDRSLPLQLLAAAFALLVVAVARLRGLAALAGLGLGYLMVWRFMLPALRAGEHPAAVAFVGCAAVMIVILYLSHGISAKTTTALFGTTAGLAVTAGLADWAVGSAHLTGLTGEDSLTLSQLVGRGSLSGLVLCGIIVAGLGVLNDVTVTQASAVWELRQHAPHLGLVGLFGAGMRIGRDHLASTVYTIAFVYAGSALPTLLLIQLYQRPWSQLLTTAQIAEELVRTGVGAIGLILAIPLTTLIAATIAVSAGTPPAANPQAPTARHRGQHRSQAFDSVPVPAERHRDEHRIPPPQQADRPSDPGPSRPPRTAYDGDRHARGSW